MAKSKVYFMDLATSPGKHLLKKFKSLLIQSGINNIYSEKEMIAIKLHFGEEGNRRLAEVVAPALLEEL